MFKSHYVVWKRTAIRRNPDFAKAFKSHYVVWKQRIKMNVKKIIVAV